MREMKDSGIEWIGQIPKDWEITKIGMLYNLRITKVSDTDYLPLSVTKMGVLPQLETVAKTNAHDDRKLVKKGDFVINSRSDRRGSCGISNYNGSVSLINTVLEPKNNMNSGYYSWLFKTVQFADEFYKNGHGIVDDLWTTGWQDMKRIVLPVPQYSEQQQITDFLNTQCSEIDATAEDIQKEISLLEDYKKSVVTEAVTKGLNPDAEMKDSGIEWIGEIPKDWCVKNGKYVFNVYGMSVNDDFINDTDEESYKIKYYKVDNLNEATEQFYVKSNFVNFGIKIYEIKGPIILVPKRGGAIYTNKVRIEKEACLFDSNIMGLTTNNHVRFMAYVLYGRGLSDIGDVTTIPQINKKHIDVLKIPVPSINEQEVIVDDLDNKCSEIDTLIADKKRQLDILADYKKSIIYEYVTGKKEVI